MSEPITLYTVGTANGYPIAVALEELEVPYKLRTISFKETEQKSDWFLKINPNGRIPAIVDHKNKEGDFPVFETSAILLYLAQHYDPERRISYDPITEPNLYSEELQWMLFAHGGVGPMQGQANHFFRYAREKVEYGIKRYQDETKRLFSVLEKRLEGREWLVGPHYGLADIKTFPWVAIGPWSGIDMAPYPNIQAWLERIQARPKTYKGLGVPSRFNLEETLRNAEKIAAESAANFGFKK
ncbi:glutathione S-transferase [Gautieria morchelliformis]|nr:glutathione S-transferase [Gautieria morchelliformis]